MFCPNCGTDCGTFKFCPECGTKLPGHTQPAPERPPVLDISEIPLGKFKDTLGYMELHETEILFHRNLPIAGVFDIKIPYNELTRAEYCPAGAVKAGFLTVRWTGNRYLPIPTKHMDFFADLTTISFKAKENDRVYRVYLALKTAELRNYIYIQDVDFEEKQAELNALGVLYCEKCLSTNISAKKQGYNLAGGLAGNHLAPGVGLLVGNIGANDTVCICGNCSYIWRIK